jgi:hypothetical protein
MSAGFASPKVRSRQSARRAAPIFCEVVRDDGFVLLSRSVLDLSDSGMRASFADEAVARGLVGKLTIGEPLWVSFRADHIGLWFDFEAEVARVSSGRRPQDDGASFGVRFLTRWDAGRSSAPALSRLLLRSGISKMKKLVAPPALRGKRSAAAPRIDAFGIANAGDAKPSADALLRACFP